MKNYVIFNGLKFHWNFKLLPNGFLAITLFGNVFFRMSKEELNRYMKTNECKIVANHERIHMLQAKSFKLGYFSFYPVYIWYWIKNLFKYGVKNNVAYFNIPFEKEAYTMQYDFDYSETNWKNYK